jgi:hypothetical protein
MQIIVVKQILDKNGNGLRLVDQVCYWVCNPLLNPHLCFIWHYTLMSKKRIILLIPSTHYICLTTCQCDSPWLLKNWAMISIITCMSGLVLTM